MQITPLRHIFIVAHARTGGTWLGKLFDVFPNVKYLWEPNAFQHPRPEHMGNWDLDDPVSIWCRAYLFKNHIPILPVFEKSQMEIAVYKLHQVLGDIARHGTFWNWPMFELIREKLQAQVIHLVRHPMRWSASVARWGPEHLTLESHEIYALRNREFWDRYAGKPWYQMVRHEDLVESRERIRQLILGHGLVPSRRFEAFCEMTHSGDGDPDPHAHSIMMKPDTVLDRWKELPSRIQEVADRYTREAWAWAGYQPLLEAVTA